ncbi:MAG TPA: D-glycero-beta-D-manno-heptose 1-phosphate adenylyltransferase [Pirellulales bacterium]|nr:D-glycero-beta-D-manno-heptose 1-phosphate adenylyltransferase [Pirellulales bacterium]
MSSNDLLHVLETLGRPRILVLGDLILDRYTWGNAERVSQEAPVIVLRADRREARLGGAANVANMLAGLEARVTCSGVVGNDAAGVELVQLLAHAGIDCDLVLEDANRPTSVKERFVGRASTRHPSQILRVDHENCDPLGAEMERQFIESIASRMPDHDALLISDYGKGVCTPRLLKAAIEAAHRSGVPVMVDPSRSCPLVDYRGATVIKPNRLEAELATGRKIAGAADALAAGRQLCQDLDAKMALITLDRDGMMLVQRDGTGETFPTRARAVYDITGAGDMVMAMVGLCLAGRVAAADAVRLGNVAAGLEVERAGVAVIYRDELRRELVSLGGGSQKIVTREQAGLLALEHRRHGQKIVFTNGCFDLLHVGHVTYLTEAAALGDVLVVGVNSDASVRKLKGDSRPVIGQSDRAAMLAALACVRYVVVFDDDTPHALLHAIQPDVLVKGGTYTTDEVVGHEIVEAYGGAVCVTGVVDGISTTNILASLSRATSGQPAEVRSNLETNQPVDFPDETPRLRRAG